MNFVTGRTVFFANNDFDSQSYSLNELTKMANSLSVKLYGDVDWWQFTSGFSKTLWVPVGDIKQCDVGRKKVMTRSTPASINMAV